MKYSFTLLLLTGLFLTILVPAPVYAADPPALMWQTVLGGARDDEARGVDQTSDGGYIVAGTTGMTGGDTDVMAARLGPDGNLLWQKTFGGPDDDKGYGIQQTADGGCVIVGYTTVSRYSESYVQYTTYSDYNDYGSVHSNSDTGSSYGSSYGSGYDSRYDSADTGAAGQSGKYTVNVELATAAPRYTYGYTGYVSVTKDRDVWVIKLDPAGDIEWQKALGGYGKDEGYDIQQTTDGGYIVAGSAYSSNSGDVGINHGAGDVWVVKLSSAGGIQWQRPLGGYGEDAGYSIRQTPDGGYILAGTTASGNSGDVGGNHGDDDAWVVKLSSAGDIRWQKTYGGSGADSGSCIRPTTDGGYIFTGSTASDRSGDVGANHGAADVWAVKLDSTGTIVWQSVLGGDRTDQGYGILQATGGGYVVAGSAASGNSGDAGSNHGSGDFWVVKLDPSGNLLWQELLGGDRNEQAYSIRQTRDGGFVLAGSTGSGNSGDVEPNHGLTDFWTVKLSADTGGAVQTTPVPSAGQASANYRVGFDGLSYNADGRQTLDIDLAKARQSRATVSLYTDRVEIFQKAPDGILLRFRGRDFALQGDRITGTAQSAEMVTDPVGAPLTPGTVAGSVRADLSELTQEGGMRTTINDTPSASLTDTFRAVLLRNGLEYGTVAYTYEITKSNMPATGIARVNLSLPEPWVNDHGGPDAVRIIRVSDTTGTAELLPLILVGTDRQRAMYFEGVSVNGTSVFGLVTLKASKMIDTAGQPPAQHPAVTTFLGMVSWFSGFLLQNPAGALAIVACAGAAYAGRKRGMW